MPLGLPQALRKIYQAGDHFGGEDRLVGVAQYRILERLTELPALHKVRALSGADLAVQELAQRLQGEVLLLQRRQALKEFVAQNIETGFLKTGDREQVDHLVSIYRAANDLNVQVARERALTGEVANRNADRDVRRRIYESRVNELNRRTAAGGALSEYDTETVTDSDVDPIDYSLAEKEIANIAQRRGVSSPEDLAKIADEIGYELLGDAILQGYWSKTLGGDFSLKKKPEVKRVSRRRPGNLPAAPGPRAAQAAPTKAGDVNGSRRPALDEIWGKQVR